MLKQFFIKNTLNLRPNAFTVTIIANYLHKKAIVGNDFLIFWLFL